MTLSERFLKRRNFCLSMLHSRFLVRNRECNTERGFKNQLYIELGCRLCSTTDCDANCISTIEFHSEVCRSKVTNLNLFFCQKLYLTTVVFFRFLIFCWILQGFLTLFFPTFGYGTQGHHGRFLAGMTASVMATSPVCYHKPPPLSISQSPGKTVLVAP